MIADYDPVWPERFESHRRRIDETLGPTAQRIEHVGSTSVPGLAAKPIIDIQVSVTDPEHEASYVQALERAGYHLRVREVGHRMLRTTERDVHVHVCASGSDWERRHLVFRDWLRHNAPDRRLYESTKRRLAERRWPTTDHYADAKTPVIDEIMRRALRTGAETSEG
ncbi:MAG: GrpB family protein [Ilumatobacteraceae bacterium]